MNSALLAALLALAPPALAGDGYVDAVNGSDSNSGTSEAAAWRTVTFALGQIPASGADTVHVLPGNYTVLWLARSLQLPAPDPTPFGDRWLPASLLELVATRKVLGSNPVRHTVYVPNVAARIGQPFSFQALSRSTAAPAGAAWTDALTVTITP